VTWGGIVKVVLVLGDKRRHRPRRWLESQATSVRLKLMRR
jgi:hypothetical protein